MTNTERLAKAQAIASIASAIAIPIVIALVGWWVQSSISSEGIKKDYVQMAITILREGDKSKDAELREWAASVLERHSPVPFGLSLRSKIAQGGLFLTPMMMPPVPKILMEPPVELKKLPEGRDVSMRELLLNVVENYGRCHENRIKLEGWQEWAREMQKIDEDWRSRALKDWKAPKPPK